MLKLLKSISGMTGLEFLVPAVIVGVSLFIFAWVTCPYEDSYLVKESIPYGRAVYQKHYSSGELMSKHWFATADSDIATRTKYLLDIRFADNEKVFYRNIWHVKIDGEWLKCVCDPTGRFLYVGLKPDYPAWTMSSEEQEIRDLIGIE